MGRKKQSDLAEFQDWLEQTIFVDGSTACVYASHVRAALPWLTDLQDEGSVTTGFSNMSVNCSRKVLSGRRTAWKHFATYAREEKGIELAQPKKTSYRGGPPDLPHEVRAAVAWLTSGRRFKHKQIPALRWSMLHPAHAGSSTVSLANPFSPQEQIEVPAEHIEALQNHAQVSPEADGPVLPIKPGSSVPFPWQALRRELKAYRDAAGMDEVLENWDAFQRNAGSALQVEHQARAEMAEVMAQRDGVRTGAAPFIPSHSTQDLMSLIEQGGSPPDQQDPQDPRDQQDPRGPQDRQDRQDLKRQELPGEAGLTSGVGESGSQEAGAQGAQGPQGPQEDQNSHDPQLDYPPHLTTCSHCGHPEDQHIPVARGEHVTNNCAEENGYEADTCQMCRGVCPGRHVFVAASGGG
tara:strand:+ start:1194 stop:2417 length:1224 start_codon:yes stop_codon:yes gene_type:complete